MSTTTIAKAAETPAPESMTPLSNWVLSTTIQIQGPAPTYKVSLLDGTLLTASYTRSLRDASVVILTAGIVLAIFLRNIAVASQYLRTIAARDKSLFYLLLFAQIWGPIAVLAVLLPLAVPSVNCTAVNIVAGVSIQISFILLTSGIMGIKAYRCLNRSRAVLAAIAITQISALALSGVEVPKLTSKRSLAGICVLTKDLSLIPTAFILSTIETLVFVGMCFGYTIWNSSRRNANLGRLSLDLSNEQARGWWDYAPTIPGAQTATNAPSVTRGWWEYAPTGAPTATNAPSLARSNSVSTAGGGATSARREEAISRAAETLTLGSVARNLRGTAPGGGWEKIDDEEHPGLAHRDSQHSTEDDDGPRFTRIVLLNDAVKNELFYTGVILAFHTVCMVMLPISSRSPHLWPPVFWLGMSWCSTSVLVIRSFVPVIRRHEREAILREPVVPGWGPDPMDVPSGRMMQKQTPWGRAISVSTGSVLSLPTVRRRGSTATSVAAQSTVAFLSAAHSNAFQKSNWVPGPPTLRNKRSNLTPTTTNATTGHDTLLAPGGTTATPLLPLNSSTVWPGQPPAAPTFANPFADPAARNNTAADGVLVDVTVLPNSPGANGPAPELWRRGSLSGISVAPSPAGPPRGKKTTPDARAPPGSVSPAATLVPIGETATPVTASFNTTTSANPSPAPRQTGPLLDLESEPRPHIRTASPQPRRGDQRHVRDGSRTIAFDLDAGTIRRSPLGGGAPDTLHPPSTRGKR